MRTKRLRLPDPPRPLKPGDRVELALSEARHGVLSLRLRPGDKIELTGPDGAAPALVAVSEKGPPPRLTAEITGPLQKPAIPPGPALIIPLIRPQRFEWALEKAVELSASKIIPYTSSRTRVRASELGAAKRARWEKIAWEAVKQCGRLDAPEILPPDALSAVLERFAPEKDSASLLLLDKAGALLKSQRSEKNSVLLAGPEGGFSPEEKEEALQAGFSPFSLGPYTLRTETALLKALSILTAEEEGGPLGAGLEM
jgi:16S rRNA (uracil1498-N3)-methyltransferase